MIYQKSADVHEVKTRVRSLKALAVVAISCASFISTDATPSLANISDNPGFSAGSYSVCNYPNSGDSTTSYGPDRNAAGITLTSSHWRCSKEGQAVSGATTVAVNQPLLMEKLDLQTPAFGNSGYQRNLVSIEWDFESDGVVDLTDNGPWNSWYLDRGHPYARGTYFSASHTWTTVGTQTVSVKANYDDSTSDQVSGTVAVVEDTATAVLNRIDRPTGIPNDGVPILSGSQHLLSAARSTAVSGFISKYEWDLDGDGTFETDGGASSSYTASFPSAGTKTVGVRVTSRGGSTSSATMALEVRQAPPVGEPGVSIEDGASSTNTKAVKLNLVWPDFATEARISNDGGFAASKTKTVALASSVDWNLDDSIKGVFTKVVYVRFNGSGLDTTKTYSDDVILDTNAPVIDSSSAAVSGASIVFSLKATDDITGVDKVEVSNAGNVISKPYSAKITVVPSSIGLVAFSAGVEKAASSSVRLRVSDSAGNWTSWSTVVISGSKLATVATAARPIRIKLNKSATGRAIAKFAKVKVTTGSKIAMRVSTGSVKNCKVSGSSVVGTRAGSCKLVLVVTPIRGPAISRNVVLKIVK